jgi:hypothetical protein
MGGCVKLETTREIEREREREREREEHRRTTEGRVGGEGCTAPAESGKALAERGEREARISRREERQGVKRRNSTLHGEQLPGSGVLFRPAG